MSSQVSKSNQASNQVCVQIVNDIPVIRQTAARLLNAMRLERLKEAFRFAEIPFTVYVDPNVSRYSDYRWSIAVDERDLDYAKELAGVLATFP